MPYTKLFTERPNNTPYLFLAPMESLGDRAFRRSIARIGGFDEACTEFLRVPKNAHTPSLAKRYLANEIHPIPLAAQVMGYDPILLAELTQVLAERGAPRVELNCGCPSNTVTGRGAGSSLLKDPEQLFRIAHAMVKSGTVPISIKLRSGYEDTSLFRENLLAAQESGAAFITLHPRTKVEGYRPPADWDLIALAKETLSIPLVGNGDILCVNDAVKMLAHTRCDALMIGRGAVRNPWIFQEIRCHFEKTKSPVNWKDTEAYLRGFLDELAIYCPPRVQTNRLKQIACHLFKATENLEKKLRDLLRTKSEPEHFIEKIITEIKLSYEEEKKNDGNKSYIPL